MTKKQIKSTIFKTKKHLHEISRSIPDAIEVKRNSRPKAKRPAGRHIAFPSTFMPASGGTDAGDRALTVFFS